MDKYMVAVCQMDSQADKEENLRKAASMIDEAAEKGAKLVLFPETMNYMGREIAQAAETIPGKTSDLISEKARQHGIWIAAGSIYETDAKIDAAKVTEMDEDPGTEAEQLHTDMPNRPKNTLFLVDDQGSIRACYSKTHMFDITLEERVYKESDSIAPGNEIIVVDTPLGKLGMAICYDLRFGELFRLMALAGAEVILLPASFTRKTGQDHWEPLLKARAIENGVYVLAANQIGKKYNMTALGKSMILDPWGNKMAEADDREEIIYCEIDLKEVKKIRAKIPSLANRREDLYCLEGLVKILKE